MKTIKIIFVSIFLIIIVLLVSLTNTEPEVVSEIDNRMLAKFNVEEVGLAKATDAYFKDRLGYREEMIHLFDYFKRQFSPMLTKLYQRGRNNYVFFHVGKTTVDEEFIDDFCRYLRQVQDFCADRNVPFIYCLNPSKSTIYSQYLPKGYQYRNDFYPMMLQKLDKYGVNFVDNVTYLKEVAQTEQVFNVQYDAGHWNDLGAFYGTNHLLEKVSTYFPNVQPFTFDDFYIGTKVQQYLPVSKFEVNETVPFFELKNPFQDNTSVFPDVQLDKNYPYFYSYQTHQDSLPNVLFFHGSYYISAGIVKFYMNRFNHAVGIHNYQNFLNFEYYFDIFHPECVILETAEYATTRNYFDINVLKSKLK